MLLYRGYTVILFCVYFIHINILHMIVSSSLSTLQELIARQTDIPYAGQLLIFDGQLFKDCVQPLLPVSSYPDGITRENPIFCFNKDYHEANIFPTNDISECSCVYHVFRCYLRIWQNEPLFVLLDSFVRMYHSQYSLYVLPIVDVVLKSLWSTL